MQVRSIGLFALSVLACLVAAPLAVAAPGALDPTFDGDGRVTTDLGSGTEEGDAVAIQPDGKIVVLAQTEDEDSFVTTSVLIRYDSSGALDPTFDSDGILVVAGMDPADVAVQSDGKIVVVGGVLIDLGDSVTADFAVARFNTDGTPDTTFSDDGRATADFDGRWDGATAVALQADGKIVAAGGTGGNASQTSQDFAVARFNTDGTPDTSFGGDGTTNTNILGTSEQAFAVVVQTNGRVVVGGKAHQKKTGQDFALVRYRSNGALDLGFSGDGKLRTSFDVHDTLSGLALQSDGKIIAAGTAGGPSGVDFALARYTPRGRLDATFSKDGKQHTDFSKGIDEAKAVLVQGNGRIVLAGLADPPRRSNDPDFGLARYRPSGRLDASFSGDGKQRTRFGSTHGDYGFDAALQAGRIVVVGSVTLLLNGYDVGLARYSTS